jgi:RNA polymerase sigma factor (sigma-70 family)
MHGGSRKGTMNEQIAHEMIVMAAQGGDRRAMTRLVGLWHRPLVRHASRLMPDESSAMDAVQDAWIAIGKSIGKLEDPARFRAWAYRLVTNKCADVARKESRRRRADRSRQAPEPRAEGEDGLQVELRVAMRQMDDEKRAMLALHYVDGLTVVELAEVFAVPTGTVKSRLFAARKELKQRIERIES